MTALTLIFKIILSLLAAYGLGSIPFAYLIVRSAKNIDIRQVGSGNVGTTNVLRAGGPGLAGLVFACDLLKGTAAVWLARLILGDPATLAKHLPSWLNAYAIIWPLIIILAGLAAILGHSYSIWLKGSGGRGVATGLGVLLGVAPDVFLFTLLSGIILIALTRYVSVGSLFGSLLALVLMIIWAKPWPYILVTAATAGLIWWRHRPNIQRLLKGQENKIGQKVES